MVKINILTTSLEGCVSRQIDRDRYPESDYYICQNSAADIVWDIVVVYEAIEAPVSIKCKLGGLVFISGEPPYSQIYTNQFLKQFDLVVSSHKAKKGLNVLNWQQSLDWHYGMNLTKRLYSCDFNYLKSMPIPSKTKLISVITSNQRMMPGHNKRYLIIKKLMKDYAGKIDFFGKGFNFIDDKAEALDNYKFHICIENSFIRDYWTEKMADPLLGYCVPIYSGCKNINDYFDSNGCFFFDIDDYDSLKSIIDSILLNGEDIYEKKKPYLLANRNLLMNKYNLVTSVLSYTNFDEKEWEHHYIIPSKMCKTYNLELWILRFKRLFIKTKYKILKR